MTAQLSVRLLSIRQATQGRSNRIRPLQALVPFRLPVVPLIPLLIVLFGTACGEPSNSGDSGSGPGSQGWAGTTVGAMWSEDDSAFFSLSMADGSSLSVYGDRDAAGDPLQTTSTAVMTRDGDLVISRFDEAQQITRLEVQGQGVIEFLWPDDGEPLAFVTLTPAGSEIALRATVNLETLEVSEILEEIVDGAGLAAGASALAATTGVAAPDAAGAGFPGEVLTLCDDRTAGPAEGVLPVVSLTKSFGSASVTRPVEDISWTGDRWEYLARPGNVVSATVCSDFKSIACPDLNAIPPGAQSATLSAVIAVLQVTIRTLGI